MNNIGGILYKGSYIWKCLIIYGTCLPKIVNMTVQLLSVGIWENDLFQKHEGECTGGLESRGAL